MANILSVNQQQAISSLAAQGWSIRRIARELKVHRKTVKQYFPVSEAASRGADISSACSPSKCTISTAGKTGRKSVCGSHEKFIEHKLTQGLTAQRIYQDLKLEVQFTGSYESVKRFVRQLRRADPVRVWRMEVAPGEEVQVDFGAGAPIDGSDGRRRKSWVFRIVLSHSRKAYSEAVFHQDTETFLRCLENGFRHLGGVTQTINLDNLKAAVLRFDFADPDLNPKLREFARHYGTVILPCVPRTPEHKGKVERSIAYVKGNALAGRTFDCLAAQNKWLAYWEASVADLRIHGTTKRQVAQLFAQERKHLLALPASLFPVFQEAPRLVHRDSYVEVAKAYYAVPAEYIARRVWARWDQREVRLFNERWEHIQIHRRLEPGQFSKVLGIGGGKGSVQANLAYWLGRACELGSECALWAQGLVEKRGLEGMRSLMGLVSLSARHGFGAINRACARAQAKQTWRLRDVRALLQAGEIQTHFEFAQHHPLIRDLNEYALFIKSKNI